MERDCPAIQFALLVRTESEKTVPLRVVDRQTLLDIVTAMRAIDWDWSTGDVHRVLDQLGWTVLESFGEDGIVVSAGQHPCLHEIDVPFNSKGNVDRIVVGLTDVVLDPQPEDTEALNDAFADAVAAVTDVLGTPSDRRLGEDPSVLWRGPSDTFSVFRTGRGAALAWSSNDFQDVLDRLDG